MFHKISTTNIIVQVKCFFQPLTPLIPLVIPFNCSFSFSASDKVLSLLPSFPVDKYELEPSAFGAFFVKNSKEGMCWPLQSRFNLPVKVFFNDPPQFIFYLFFS